jgi:hypothetical protein
VTRQDDRTTGELTVEPHRFAMVPEWIIDAEIGDCAFRLYAVLLRYGHSSGQRMPSRSTLARRLRKSVDTVDRALKELVSVGAVVVERRARDGLHLTNNYHLRTTRPAAANPGSRDIAATSRSGAATGGRNRAAGVTAVVRPDPEHPTETTPPPTDALAARCREERSALGLPIDRWSDAAVARGVARALERGRPAMLVPEALLAVAQDAASISPARVAEAGPWWIRPATLEPQGAEIAALEAELDALDGRRAWLQRRARERLTTRGIVLSRSSVVREAVALLREEASAAQPEPARS